MAKQKDLLGDNGMAAVEGVHENEQLFDTDHPGCKKLKSAHKKWQQQLAIMDEVKQKVTDAKTVLDEIAEGIADDEAIKPDVDGTRRFRMGGLKISICCRGDLVKVKELAEKDGGDEE